MLVYQRVPKDEMPLFGSKALTPWRAARPAPQWPLPSWTSRCPLPSRAKPGFSGGPIDGRRGFLENFSTISALQQKKRGRSSTRFNGLHQQTFDYESISTAPGAEPLGWISGSQHVCMHACIYLIYLCVYIYICVCYGYQLCHICHMCTTCVYYISVNYHVLSTLTLV